MKDPSKKAQLDKIKEMAPLYEKHKFWDTQPVVHLSDPGKDMTGGVIEHKEAKDVRPTPLALPDGFVWGTFDLGNDKEMEEVRRKNEDDA